MTFVRLLTSGQATLGVNAYGVYPVPRASGAEAIVISASWVSRTDEGAGTPNMRGVATVLALARYLTSNSKNVSSRCQATHITE